GCAASTVKEVEAFLAAAHAQWKAKVYTHAPGKPELRRQYRRDEQARQFERLFLSLSGWPSDPSAANQTKEL
ncbi:MAG: hypothetical protein K2G46_06260, partial [Bacteroidales bacterium]|nr:hypothetical protein [Bacteroidales bacterium]